MQVPRLKVFAAVWAIYPLQVVADDIATPVSYSASPACATITETTGSSCPVVTGHCARPACVEVVTVTQGCDCASIFTMTACETACGRGCAKTYETVALPCILTFPGSATTTTSTMSSYPTSTRTVTPTSTYTIIPPPTYLPNSTMTTASNYSPLTPTPPTGVGEGGNTMTSTVVTTPGNVGPVSATTPSVTPVQGNTGASIRGFGAVEAGVLIGLIGAVVGMI